MLSVRYDKLVGTAPGTSTISLGQELTCLGCLGAETLSTEEYDPKAYTAAVDAFSKTFSGPTYDAQSFLIYYDLAHGLVSRTQDALRKIKTYQWFPTAVRTEINAAADRVYSTLIALRNDCFNLPAADGSCTRMWQVARDARAGKIAVIYAPRFRLNVLAVMRQCGYAADTIAYLKKEYPEGAQFAFVILGQDWLTPTKEWLASVAQTVGQNAATGMVEVITPTIDAKIQAAITQMRAEADKWAAAQQSTAAKKFGIGLLLTGLAAGGAYGVYWFVKRRRRNS